MTTRNAAPVEIRCMQVFGGNRTVEQAFELPGIDAYLSAVAFGGGRGGDIHYVSTCGHGEIVRFLVADVAGHGASVADIATHFRALVTRNLHRLDQSRLARALNAAFVANSTGGRFITTLFATFHRPSEQLVICNAGHPRPLLYRAHTRRWQLLDHGTEEHTQHMRNLPLGIIHPTDYRQFALRVHPGDRVVLYTDGICDARDRAGRAGEQRILDAVGAVDVGDCAQLATDLREALGRSLGTRAPEDDETLIVLAPTEREFAAPDIRERLRTLGKMLGVVAID